MNEQRYVLIDGQYKIYFNGYYHALPSATSTNEFIEITTPYNEEVYQIVKDLPMKVRTFELYTYDPDEDKMVCINTERNDWTKQQIAANFRDYGSFTLSITYSVQ